MELFSDLRKVCPLRPRRSQWRPPCWEFQGHQRRRQQGHRGGVVFIDHIYRSKPLWMMRHFRCPSKRLDPTDPTETTDPTDRPQIAREKIESLSLPMRRQLTSSHQKRIKVQSVHPGQPQLPRKPNCQALEWRKWRKISMIHPHPDLPHSEGLRWHAQPQMRKTQKTRKTRKNSRFQCALWVRSVV